LNSLLAILLELEWHLGDEKKKERKGIRTISYNSSITPLVRRILNSGEKNCGYMYVKVIENDK